MQHAQVMATLAQVDALRELGTKVDTLTGHVIDLEHTAHFARE